MFFCCAESRPDSDLPLFYKISENKDIDLLFICLTIKQKDIWEGADVKEKLIIALTDRGCIHK
ncbi:hypothetical protein CJZ71_13635 [Bacillus subtilis]|nr:hypothetical protein BSR08_19900 [Bacillus subtilis]AYK69172.1 hypothetical protein D9C09_05015 [Bacillus subtilis subsp. subtilis]ARI86959.1 hypothetical protein B7470_13080 [Bacillus subtilis]ASV00169.1 hypothetical protein CJZ70_18770 [Bacillus subtilis]ASV03102.1 hypothetical protein CJZ71_13635 [Bacillus subtilis]